MVKLVNRAKMTTATTGTGTITLGSASDGYQSFSTAGVADGDVVRYVIEDGSNWEIGTGTYTASGTTLTRTVSESSNSGNAITLTGSAVVFVTASQYDVPIVRDSDPAVDTNPPNVGAVWVNSTSGSMFVCTDNTVGDNVWRGITPSSTIAALAVSYLIVGGGGGGGYGGGGAGGLLSGSFSPTPSTEYTVTVGAGGGGGTSNGANSSVFSLNAIGGGRGGNGQNPVNNSGSNTGNGSSGGSGGGGGHDSDNSLPTAGGAGTEGQGNAGGGGYASSGFNPSAAGGGGGAGGTGESRAPAATTGGAGGNGLASSITGSAIVYAGGGGGAYGGAGGAGGGGGGAAGSGSSGTAGVSNSGGGGGGANCANSNLAGSGGSGVVILRSSQTATATTGSPVVTTDGDFTIYKFTGSGSITF